MRIAIAALLALFQVLPTSPRAAADETLAQPDAATLAELAPTGKMRIGIFRSAIFEGGFGADLAAYIGEKTGIPVEPKYFERDLKGFLNCAVTSECDVIALGVTPDRQKLLQFTPPFMEQDTTYLVRGDSPFQTVGDLDQPGISISVFTGSVVDKQLSTLLRKATLRESTVSEAERADLLASGDVDALADNVDQLDRWSQMVPGSRIIPGHFGVVDYGLATAPGKPAASRYLASLVQESVKSGAMAQMIAARHLRGHVPAK